METEEDEDDEPDEWVRNVTNFPRIPVFTGEHVYILYVLFVNVFLFLFCTTVTFMITVMNKSSSTATEIVLFLLF